jgi:phosphoribosylanthranilate isomerase
LVRTRIKFCGCTSAQDVEAAASCGVDAIGVIFAPDSPRQVPLETARAIARRAPALLSLVGVFVDPAAALVQAAVEAGFMPQFHGDEPAPVCEKLSGGRYIKVFHVAAGGEPAVDAAAFGRMADAYSRATWMFDTSVEGKRGGTGRSFDWERARDVARGRQIIISGGLTPDNVGACIRRARPYGVDVRSGIETGGVKDLARMRAFVRAVKEADEQT